MLKMTVGKLLDINEVEKVIAEVLFGPLEVFLVGRFQKNVDQLVL